MFYAWKAKYSGMTVSEAKRLKALEDENAKLKKLLAELMLDMATMRGLLQKMVTLVAKREAVAHLKAQLGLSERRACQIAGADRTMVRYQSQRAPDTTLRVRLRDLAPERRRFGYQRLFVLLRREGEASGINRIYRLYRKKGLTVRKRKARRNGSRSSSIRSITCRCLTRRLPNPARMETPELLGRPQDEVCQFPALEENLSFRADPDLFPQLPAGRYQTRPLSKQGAHGPSRPS